MTPGLRLGTERNTNSQAVPDSVIPQEKKQKAFGPAVQFIKDTHLKYGFQWS